MGYKLKRATIWQQGENLPSAYQEVEYIEGSGTQWIDTGVTPDANTKSQIKFMNLEVSGDVIYGFTANASGGINTCYRLFNASSRCYFDIPGLRINTNSTDIAVNNTYELEIGNYYVKNLSTGTNIVSGTTQSTIACTKSITLNHAEAWTASGGTSYTEQISKNRWYYVKIYNGNTLVRDFVPCYRKSDSVIGLYDLVNDVFYTNAGTGTFTKGNDVPALIEKKVRPTSPILFDFGDWTSSTWNRFGTQSPEGTVTKSVNQITFYNSGFCRNYMETYIIDGTRDFLLEMNADIPSTTQSNHRLGLIPSDNSTTMKFETNYESAYRNKMWCCVGATFYANGTYYGGDANSGPKNYFIKKEGTVLTMGWDNTTIYTDNNYTFASEYYLCEGVYNKTLTIYTAKLTYL